MKKNKLIYLLLFPVLFYSCAQIGTLGGGDKDEDPPVFLNGTPEDKSVNFEGDRIILQFDEFFVLKNMNSVFLSSPFMTEKPDFEINRKKLIIKINENLLDSTTYHLWFGSAIEDYHENNPLHNFSFAFSTGPVLDTMEVSGRIMNAENLSKIADMYVFLYKDYNDSTPILKTPYYIAKSDTAGNFKFDYMRPGKYRIFALSDQDGNYLFNLPNEKIAFIDSFIIPEVETKISVDSLKAGTVLHKNKEDETGDTLRSDTVIYTKEYIYSPSNLSLFAFIEDNEKQYVFNTSREMRGKLTFEFNKPITDNIEILGLDFYLDYNKIFTEKTDTLRDIVYWLKDESLYNKDTLIFTVSYYNKDSLDRDYQETDTVKLSFDIAADTLKKTVIFADLKQDQDSFSAYILESETPINMYDTSKIKLFELYDTLVTDTREQELIRYMRPAPEKLYFELKRPFVNSLDIRFLNIEKDVSFVKNFSNNNKITECIIQDEDVYKKDTLKILLTYDNAFFFGQTQKFSDTLLMPLYKQGLKKVNRPSSDTLVFSFKKELAKETYITAQNYDVENWYTIIPQADKEKLFIKITNKGIAEEDTLLLTVRINDYDNTLGDKIDFEYSKQAIYKREIQKILGFSRPEQNQILIITNLPVDDDFSLHLANFPKQKDWYLKNFNKLKDSVFINITDPGIIQKDTLKVVADYNVKLNKGLTVQNSDTLNTIYQKYKRKKRHPGSQGDNTQTNKKGEKLYTVNIEIPVQYNIERDSVSERKLNLIYPWKTGNEYILRLDSSALKDIYGSGTPKKEKKFKIREKDFYGSVQIHLLDVKRISDKNFYNQNDTLLNDSARNTELPEGQLLIVISDSKNNVLGMKEVTKDDTLSFDNLEPGNYRLKIIYDKNSNKKWDTGDFLKNIQPERVLIYPNEIAIKSNWLNLVDWKIEPPKIKIYGKQEQQKEEKKETPRL